MEEKVDRDKQEEPEDDSLCKHCANREECSGHHMMCIDFKPVKLEKHPEDTL